MKRVSMFVPGMCAGAVIMVFLLALVVGAASSERLRTAESQTFTITYYPTATATPQQVAQLDHSIAQPVLNAPAADSATSIVQAMQTSPKSGACNDRSNITDIAEGQSIAISNDCPISASLEAIFTETEMCPIQPNTCAYGRLVGNLDAGILFADAPAGQDSQARLMHPAMLRPLAALRDAVLSGWQGDYSLIILSAYEDAGRKEDGDLFESDLRTQGQLAIFTLSPPITSTMARNGREANLLASLCGMAIRAGFDWVKNDGNACRAAIKGPRLCDACRMAGTRMSMSVGELPTLTPIPAGSITPTATVPAPTQEPQQSQGSPPPESESGQ